MTRRGTAEIGGYSRHGWIPPPSWTIGTIINWHSWDDLGQVGLHLTPIRWGVTGDYTGTPWTPRDP